MPTKKKSMQYYAKIAAEVRRDILDMICRSKGPHIGPCYSCVDLLVGLYFGGMNVSPKKAASSGRDRFIFSKGHASPALYAVLHRRGFLTDADLAGFAVNGGTLQQHPDYNVKKGIEVSSGSLGHGLSLGAGMAYALKKDRSAARVFVLVSDGELAEGSTWEAVLFAGHHKLDNLTLIVDYNRMYALGPAKGTLNLDPLAEKFKVFNWTARVIDGHSFKAIKKTLAGLPFHKDRPSVIVADTLKGKGVSFMENSLRWHYCYPDET
ncbi:MAG: transketolase, partial [Candidatus Omnitrophota bacterium]